MLFAVLLGTVTKDMSAAKAVKSVYSQNDSSDKDDTKDDDCDTKDVTGKELADKFHLSHSYFTFNAHLYSTLFSCVSMRSNSIENPYLESISLPPELLS
ncbi:MAG: hypothetical protein JWO03_3915 [Bacteroidetes bacterium]|nr:hypothetical protein [Bacteroidota bacterium]